MSVSILANFLQHCSQRMSNSEGNHVQQGVALSDERNTALFMELTLIDPEDPYVIVCH